MQTTKRRILYVDEDGERSFIVATRLRSENYDPVTTPFASDALELARSESFDLYVLSRRFPLESGAYLCQKLFELTPDTPLISFTNSFNDRYEQEMIRSGGHEYLVEAGSLNELLAVMKYLPTAKNKPALGAA
jgi:DNA-binding response OmpR family regulator